MPWRREPRFNTFKQSKVSHLLKSKRYLSKIEHVNGSTLGTQVSVSSEPYLPR